MAKGKSLANSEGFNEVQLSQIRMVVNEGLDQVVLPVINDVIETEKQHSGVLKQHSEILKQHSEVLKQHSEQLEDHGLTLHRMEGKLDAVTGYHDEEIQRVLKHLKLKPISTGD